MKIAILGYGVVGSGAYEVAQAAHNIEVKRVLYKRPIDELGDIVTTEYEDILKDEEIELVAECIGGLHPAYEYVSAALKSGKHVVTPNKNLVAAYWDELHDLAREHGAEFRYTASAGGGIPWLFNLRRQSRSDEILSISGIVNGTITFWILCITSQLILQRSLQRHRSSDMQRRIRLRISEVSIHSVSA